MIYGVGIDIVPKAQIMKIIRRTKNAMAHRILTDLELIKMPKKLDLQISFLAKRFAIKEACAKALKTGIRRGINFKSFEIATDDLGAPSVQVLHAAKQYCLHHNISNIHISVTDDINQVIAYAIAETRE